MAYDGTLKFDTSMDASGFQEGANKLGDIVKGLGVFKIMEQGFQAVTASIDKAVSRYDTLSRFPKIMEQMGFSAEETDASMQKLSNGIQGLPTALDQITGSAQRIASMTGDLVGAADITLALNNAFLASGSSSDAASRGMEQYMQIIGRGKPEMEDWKTLQETMPYALQKVAESFGFAGTSATRDFYAALQSGEITVEQMNARFVELSTETGGFAEVAKTATGGISTAVTNMQTSIVRGVTGIVTSIDNGLSKTRFKSIENIINSTGKAIGSVLNGVAGVFGFVASKADILVPAIVAVGTATAAYKVTTAAATLAAKAAGVAIDGNITKANLDAISTALLASAKKGLATATGSATTALAMLTAGEATAAQVGALLTVKEAALAAIKGVLSGQIGLATAAQLIWNAAVSANPIGLAIVVIVALTAAIVGLVKWLSSSSAEYKKQKEEVEALTTAQEELTASTEESADAYKSSTAEITASAKVSKDLVGTLKAVSSSTASAGEKNRKMSATIDQLNTAVDGLNIAYDEESGEIRNINTGQKISLEQLEQLVSAKSELAQANAWQERANELVREQVKIQEDLAVIEAKKQEISENDNLSAREKKKLIKELDEAAEGHAATMADVGMRLDIVNENLATSNTAAAESVINDYERMEQAITENGESIDDVAARWGVSVESIKAAWSDAGGSFDAFVTSQDERLADYQESVKSHSENVINSFKEIPAEYEMSAQEMIEVLRTNRERYAEWKQAMTEISGQVSAETLAELEKLGPGALSAINEMRENGGAGLREFDREIRTIVGDSTGYAIQECNDPAFIAAPAGAFSAAAQQVAKNTALSTAITGQMEDAKASVEAVDFSAVGQDIAADIAAGLNSADVNGAMNGITAAIKNNTGKVTSAISSMSTTVLNTLRALKTLAVNIATQMMAETSRAVVTRAGAVRESVAGMGSGVLSTLDAMKAQAARSTAQMMAEINSAIVSRTGIVCAASASLANGVEGGLCGMVGGAEDLSNRMMDGILIAMGRKADILYAKAREIARRIADTMRAALDVHSPSRVMIRLFEYVMWGVYRGMDGMAGTLYREAESISGGIAERLSVSPADVNTGLSLIQAAAELQTGRLVAVSRDFIARARAISARTAPVSSYYDSNVPQTDRRTTAQLQATIEVPVMLDGREIARGTARYTGEQMDFEVM